MAVRKIAIPKYDEMFKAFLNCLADGEEHPFKEIVAYCSDSFNLTEEERKLTTSSGQAIISNRVGWTRTYLKKAGLIVNTSRGILKITEEGKRVLSEKIIDLDFLMKYESFREFVSRENNADKKKQQEEESIQGAISSFSPQEQIDNAISEMNHALADELMDEVIKISPYAFEKLIIDLLIAMGYGSPLNKQNAVTQKSGDEGIDGVLKADKFGFDSIYIQAKQWKTDSVVGRPEVQKFGGAMMGQGANKGLFITTAKFTNEAIDYAKKNLSSKIVLVDGETLAKLMIEYDIGVSTVKTYLVKKVDTDFFTDFS